MDDTQSISYLALATGMVPLITSSVEWTTPILLGGYTATGSIAGPILQFVNVVVGVLIYLPFVKLLDCRTEEEAIRAYTPFVDFFKQNEQELAGKRLIDMDDMNGELPKGLFSHQNCREIITAITQLASTLNLIVIAEYVETAEERDLLHEIGCDCYHFLRLCR